MLRSIPKHLFLLASPGHSGGLVHATFLCSVFSGCQGDSCLSALYNPGVCAQFLQEIVRGRIFFLSTITNSPESHLSTHALSFLSAFRKALLVTGEWSGMDSVMAQTGAAPGKDLGLRTHASKDFPQDSVTWHNPFNPASLSKELQVDV